jgi:hypothetical protein
MTQLVRERGGRGAFTPLPGDLSVLDDLLIVPHSEAKGDWQVALTAPWTGITALVDERQGTCLTADTPGVFTKVPPGIYGMK